MNLSSHEPLEVSKHEGYHVVTNCLGHVFIPSLLTKSCQKLSKKKPKVILEQTMVAWTVQAPFAYLIKLFGQHSEFIPFNGKTLSILGLLVSEPTSSFSPFLSKDHIESTYPISVKVISHAPISWREKLFSKESIDALTMCKMNQKFPSKINFA